MTDAKLSGAQARAERLKQKSNARKQARAANASKARDAKRALDAQAMTTLVCPHCGHSMTEHWSNSNGIMVCMSFGCNCPGVDPQATPLA